MLYLRAMREMPGVLPEHVEPLEIAIEAQVKLLNNLSDAMGSPDRARKDVSIGDLGMVGMGLGANALPRANGPVKVLAKKGTTM
jgi:hypothetical protein